MILPVVVWFLLFQYWPMTWLSISFFDYNLYLGFVGSKFVGFQNFIKFFTGMDFWRLMRNVLLLNFYALLVGFPAPIIFALFLNEMRSAKVKKVIQTVSFLPVFLSRWSALCRGDGIFVPVHRTFGGYFEILRKRTDLFLGRCEIFPDNHGIFRHLADDGVQRNCISVGVDGCGCESV